MPVFGLPLLFVSIQGSIEAIVWNSIIKPAFPAIHVRIPTEAKIWIISLLTTLVDYICAHTISPGYLEVSSAEHESTRYDIVEDLYCAKCNKPRPERCHHCKDCGRCVYLMDHHCFLLDNCIGHRNYRSFVLFLFSFTFHAVISSFLSISSFIVIDTTYVEWLILTSLLIYYCVVGSAVIYQLYYQIGFLLHNSTWIDKTTMRYQRGIYNAAKIPNVCPFDTGSVITNLKVRLGKNPIMWLIPLPNTEKITEFIKNPKYTPIKDINLKDYFNGVDEKSGLLPPSRFREQLSRSNG